MLTPRTRTRPDPDAAPAPPAGPPVEEPVPGFIATWLGTGRGTRSRPRLPARLGAWLVPAVLFVLVVGLHVALSRAMRAPVVHADEFGYLSDARWLARGGPRPGVPYAPGYPLLLAPLWLLSDHAATVYRWALHVNALLAGAAVVLVYALARRLAPDGPVAAWVSAAVVVAAFPALLLYPNIVESENLLVPGFLAVCLLVHRAVERPTTARWVAAAAGSGLLFWVHPRMIGVAAALAVIAAWLLRPWRVHAGTLGVVAGTLAATLGLGALLTRWVTRADPGQALPPSGGPGTGVLSRTASPAGLGHVAAMLAGEVYYLIAGSAGLFALGVVALWRSRRPGGAGPRRAALAGFIGLSLVAVAVVAAATLEPGGRVDTASYGRYDEVVAVPVLLLGALAGAGLATVRRGAAGRGPAGRQGARRARALISWTVLVTIVGLAVTGAAVAIERGGSVRGTLQLTNVFAFAAPFRLSGGTLEVALFAALGLGAAVAVVALFRWKALAGALAAVALFAPSAVYGHGELARQSSGALAERLVPTTLVAVQRTFGAPGCVGWDSSVNDQFNFYNSRLFDPDVPFLVFDSSRGEPPCGPLVAAGRSLSSNPAYAGARLVSYGHSPEAVWVLPGSLQSRLDAAGWLLPAGFPAALPVAAHRGSIAVVSPAGAAAAVATVRPPTRLPVAAGSTTPVRLQVTHRGAGSPWPDASSVGTVPLDAVRVGIWWFHGGDGDGAYVATGRADLRATTLPGGSTHVVADLAAVDLHGAALAPGDYDVKLSLIQEGVTTFDDGTPPVWLRVTVTRP